MLVKFEIVNKQLKQSYKRKLPLSHDILSEAKPKVILGGSRYKRNSLHCLSINDLIKKNNVQRVLAKMVPFNEQIKSF